MRTWNLLKNIKTPDRVPGLVVGDFNEILFHFEKVRGRPRNENFISNFRNTMEDCGLSDLGFKGDPFTWSNKHKLDSYTKERLDSKPKLG